MASLRALALFVVFIAFVSLGCSDSEDSARPPSNDSAAIVDSAALDSEDTAVDPCALTGGDGILHPDRLAETLFQTNDRGAAMDYYSFRYNNAMWAYPIEGCDEMAPIFFGVSGITVILPPNGTVYFAFNDAQEQPILNILALVDQISPLCE